VRVESGTIRGQSPISPRRPERIAGVKSGIGDCPRIQKDVKVLDGGVAMWPYEKERA